MDTRSVDSKLNSSSFSKQFITARGRAPSFGALQPTFLVVCLTILVVYCQPFAAVVQNLNQATSNKNLDQLAPNQQQHDSSQSGTQQNGALEAELNSIVQQHDALDNKQLAEAIISRLMVDNLTGSNLLSGANELENDISLEMGQSGEPFGQEQAAPEFGVGQATAATAAIGPIEAIRLRKLMSVLHNFETALANGGGINGGQSLMPFPILPSSQAGTMKRAAMKMGSLLQQQQQRQSASPYSRNYDFGLGKRPDSAISGNILRFGDASLGGQIQPVSQFGKRPSSHRYDFGLGKRVASPAYPRYDFGLGKRAPNRIRYDFGLGK